MFLYFKTQSARIVITQKRPAIGCFRLQQLKAPIHGHSPRCYLSWLKEKQRKRGMIRGVLLQRAKQKGRLMPKRRPARSRAHSQSTFDIFWLVFLSYLW